MRTQHLWLVLAFSLVAPSVAHAHTHVWDFYFGPSYAHASHLTGFQVTFGWPWPLENDWLHRVSTVVDTSVHTGIHDQGELRRSMISVGLRFTPHDETARHLFSFQVLASRASDNWDSRDLRPDRTDKGWGVTTGAIYEFLLDQSTGGKGWAYRAQGDFVGNHVDNFLRLSTGFAYHFK